MALGDWFRWLRLPEKPQENMIPPETIGVILEDKDLVGPMVGIPLDEIPEGAEVIPDEELSLILDNQDLLSGQWITVTSTNVAALKYNVADATLDVEYQDNRFYKYFDVPPAFFIEWLNAGSPGRFSWDYVRRPNAYRYQRFGGLGTRPVGGDNVKQVSWL